MSDFVDALSGGELRASLVAIRDRLADELSPTEHVAGCECKCGPPPASGRDVAALAKELRAVIAQIEALPGEVGADPLDDIAGNVLRMVPRREDRRPGTAATKRS